MMRLRSVLVLAPVVAAAACVEPPSPPPPPPPKQAVRAAPPPVTPDTSALPDRQTVPGTWVYRQDARGSIALFGRADADAIFILRCDRAGKRVFASVPGGTAGSLRLSGTSGGARSFTAQPTGGQPAYVAAVIPARDPVLDAMGFSRGRFRIGFAASPDMLIPAWPEFTRVVEDCRG
jgi:hypothetical protein